MIVANFGLIVGVVFEIITNNLALGIGLGIGAGIDLSRRK